MARFGDRDRSRKNYRGQASGHFAGEDRGKGLFVKEIEDALLKREIDIAIHSMKDVPSEIPDSLEIGAVPKREDPRDVLVSKGGRTIKELPGGARIGTGSLRRGIQLRHKFPEMEIIQIRGNLETRLKKIESEGLEAVILAAAGLGRLGWLDRVSQFIPEDIMIPAIGQGALAVEMRKGDDLVFSTISFLNHAESCTAVLAERAFLRVFGGGCQLPIAAHATIGPQCLLMTAMVGSLDGKRMIRDEISGEAREAEGLGTLLAERVLERGGREIMATVPH